jgi:hypothetical protein
MSDNHCSVVQLSRMLQNLDNWLVKATEHANKKKFDPQVLLEARLAPDMYPLVRQVQAACDGAKFLAARLAGREPPKHPDTERTMEELHGRIRNVREYLATFSPADFNSDHARVIPLPFLPGQGLSASDYLHQMSLPNAYFHVCMAYAILRHNGVDLTKTDYIGSLDVKPV